MDDGALVGVGEGVKHAGGDAERFARRQLAARGEHLLHVGAFDEIQDEGDQPIGGLPRVMHRDDVRVLEPRHGLGLAFEARGEIDFAALQAGREDLDRDEAIEAALPASINRAHAAAPEQRGNLLLREPRLEFCRYRRLPAATGDGQFRAEQAVDRGVTQGHEWCGTFCHTWPARGAASCCDTCRSASRRRPEIPCR